MGLYGLFFSIVKAKFVKSIFVEEVRAESFFDGDNDAGCNNAIDGSRDDSR
jgi:hypothetical protein